MLFTDGMLRKVLSLCPTLQEQIVGAIGSHGSPFDASFASYCVIVKPPLALMLVCAQRLFGPKEYFDSD